MTVTFERYTGGKFVTGWAVQVPAPRKATATTPTSSAAPGSGAANEVGLAEVAMSSCIRNAAERQWKWTGMGTRRLEGLSV